jgi:hypothetical protein
MKYDDCSAIGQDMDIFTGNLRMVQPDATTINRGYTGMWKTIRKDQTCWLISWWFLSFKWTVF